MYRVSILFSVLFTANAALFGLIGTEQSAAVKGKLTCNGEPAGDIRVKLYEKEASIDILMSEGVSSGDGTFELEGYKTELSTIDPKLNIYHKCGYTGALSSYCYKKLSITIPDDYVSEGRNPQKTFDIGTINLAGRFSGTGTDCFN